MSKAATTTTTPVLFARTVADLLQSHFSKREDSRVEWAQAGGPEASWEPPQRVFPEFKNANLRYLVREGHSEGYQVHVLHQPEYRNEEQFQILLVVKCLCSYAETFNQARIIMEFIEKLNYDEVLATQKV
jgi:hypothetical protein